MNNEFLKLILADKLNGNFTEEELQSITFQLINGKKSNLVANSNISKYDDISAFFEENIYMFEEENLIRVDIAITKFFSSYLNIRKKNLFDNYIIDDCISEFMILFLAHDRDIELKLDIVRGVENDIEIKLGVLNLDINIVANRHFMSLDEIGKLYNVSRERVRQIEKAAIGIIKEFCGYPEVDYYNTDEISFLSARKKAIVYAFKDETYNENFQCFVYSQFIKSRLNYVKNLFDNLEEKNEKTINKVFDLYATEIKRYCSLNDRFYIIKDKVSAINRFNKKIIANYFVNFLEENEYSEFSFDEDLIDEFKKSIHGKKYEASTSAEASLKNLVPNLEREADINKIGPNRYSLDTAVIDAFRDRIKVYKGIINQNLPIYSMKHFIRIFETHAEADNVDVMNLYYILRNYLKDDYKFYNHGIYEISTVIKSEVDLVVENLMSIGKSKFNITNSTAYKQKFKRVFKDNTFVIRGEWIYNYKIDPNYEYMKALDFKQVLNGVYLKRDFVDKLKSGEIDMEFYNNDFDAAFKVWAKQHNLRFKHLFATGNKKIQSITDVVYNLLDKNAIMSRSEIDEIFAAIGFTRNFHHTINKMVTERKIQMIAEDLYTVK